MHPFFYTIARLKTRAALHARFGPLKVQHAMSACDNDVIDVAAAQAGPPMLGAIGDGTIIQAILAFFESPQGQALIALLVKLLIAALAGA